MALISSDVPTIRQAPWGYSGFLGGVGHTTYKTTASPTTIYLENTSALPVVVALSASAVGAFKVELFDDVTFTAGTVIDGINSNRAYSVATVNSPMRFYSTATGVTLGSAIWTWSGHTDKPLQIFGKGSLTGASLVLAGNTKSAVTIITTGGGDVDISPTDWDMEAANVTSWPDYAGGPTQTKVAGLPSGSGSQVLHLVSSVISAQVKCATVPTFVAGRSYSVSAWMRGSSYAPEELPFEQTDAYFYLPSGSNLVVEGSLNTKPATPGWRFKSSTFYAVAGIETRFWLGCYKIWGTPSTNTYAEFDEIKVIEHTVVPASINFSYTLWDGNLFGDV